MHRTSTVNVARFNNASIKLRLHKASIYRRPEKLPTAIAPGGKRSDNDELNLAGQQTDQGRGMRATGGAVKPPSRPTNSSQRIW